KPLSSLIYYVNLFVDIFWGALYMLCKITSVA
ncbi:unnamed protein product, partial [marine sediment metagenome]